MNTEAQVRAAKNPQEAMLAIARALDRIEAAAAKPSDTYWSTPWIAPGEALDPMIRHGDSVATKSAWLSHVGGDAVVAEQERRAAEITYGEDTADVEIPPASDEKKEQRRMFERQSLRLAEHLGDDEDWNEAYAKGGPMWLYLANRDLVMSYPYELRQRFVADVEEDSPRDAQEMGRDILKHAGETGPGSTAMKMAEGNIG